MQPPWIAQITGKRASSRALKQSMSLRSDSWKASRCARRARWRASRRRRRRRRAPCRPRSACRSTRSPARASSPPSPSARTASRTAGKNAGVIVFIRSGRFSAGGRRRLSCESSKNSLRGCRSWRRRRSGVDRPIETRDGLTLRGREWPRERRARHDCHRSRPRRARRPLRACRRRSSTPGAGASSASTTAATAAATAPAAGSPPPTTCWPTCRRVLDAVRGEHPDGPLVLLGHSLGGLVAARFVAGGLAPRRRLVAAGRRAACCRRRRSTPA